MNLRAFRREQLVFNVANRPAYREAIVARLEALGFEMTRAVPDPDNISTNWDGHGIHCGCCRVTDEIFVDYRLTTLEDLYDIEHWYESHESPPELSLYVNGIGVELSDETVEAIKEAMDR